MPVCWGGMDLQESLKAQTKCQAVCAHILKNCCEMYWSLSPVCMCICLCVFFSLADDSTTRETQRNQHRQVEVVFK